jgi:hypothetical protein
MHINPNGRDRVIDQTRGEDAANRGGVLRRRISVADQRPQELIPNDAELVSRPNANAKE